MCLASYLLHDLVTCTLILSSMGHLGPGLGGAHRPCQGQPGMSTVVLGQMGHLGPGTWWCHAYVMV